MGRFLHRTITGFLLAAGHLLPGQGDSTPLIALREVQNCDGCHNGGRSQQPVLWRRCTLDCQGCHTDPAGAGPRSEWGYYYANDQMAMVNFFKPEDPLKNQGFFSVHYDGRLTVLKQDGGNQQTFPMSSELTMRVKPLTRWLHFSYSALLLGRPEDMSFRIVNEGDRRFRERWSVMVDALPMNTYVRAYRGQPMYGLRRPNHTLWIRERIGLGPFATTEAVEAGGTPNVPYWRVSSMSGDPYIAASRRQKGSTWHGGFRGVTLGWHINGSGWNTSSDTHNITMNAVGSGGNAFGLILYGERNWRDVEVLAEATDVSPFDPSRVHPSSSISEYTIAWGGFTGIMFGLIQEEMLTAAGESKRQNLFVDLHPVPILQLELWKREESGVRRVSDTLAILHLLADF